MSQTILIILNKQSLKKTFSKIKERDSHEIDELAPISEMNY